MVAGVCVSHATGGSTTDGMIDYARLAHAALGTLSGLELIGMAEQILSYGEHARTRIWTAKPLF